jgi:methane/ammonia monooxygenase subunit B
MKRWTASSGLALVALSIALVVPGAPAYAHGEKAQESFLRSRTISWTDVKFSDNDIMQGEEVVITGSFYLHENFPEALVPPTGQNGKAYLNLLTAGPTILVKERAIGGEEQVQTVTLELGKLYDFKIVGIGRREGRWHAHPVLHVGKSGPLLGPGKFIDVTANPAGFSNEVTMANGTTVNLETFGFWGVVWWQALMFLFGAVWLAYWLIPRPIIARLAFTTKGLGDRLITRRDKRLSVVMGAFVLVYVGGGMALAKVNNPQTIPPQIRRDYPKPSANVASLVETEEVKSVTYDLPSRTMVLEATVRNISDRPVRLQSFNTANLTWDNTAVVTGELEPFHWPMTVTPEPGEIAPGETKKLKLIMADDAWEDQRLISTNEVSSIIGGVLYFTDGQGGRQVQEVQAEILPPEPGALKRLFG